jgi:hypothetical protein
MARNGFQGTLSESIGVPNRDGSNIVDVDDSAGHMERP